MGIKAKNLTDQQLKDLQLEIEYDKNATDEDKRTLRTVRKELHRRADE